MPVDAAQMPPSANVDFNRVITAAQRIKPYIADLEGVLEFMAAELEENPQEMQSMIVQMVQNYAAKKQSAVKSDKKQ